MLRQKAITTALVTADTKAWAKPALIAVAAVTLAEFKQSNKFTIRCTSTTMALTTSTAMAMETSFIQATAKSLLVETARLSVKPVAIAERERAFLAQDL